jgi:hypothetical protein
MIVYTVYDPADAEMLRLWALSWERRGWDARLIARGEPAPKHAVRSNPRIINFGHLPSDRRRRLVAVRFGHVGWQAAPLVQFSPKCGPTAVLKCGRAL